MTNTTYMKRIVYLTRCKDTLIYESIIDFLLCEIFSNPWLEKCHLYYNCGGPKFCEEYKKTAASNPYDNLISELFLEFCIGDFGLTKKGNKRRGSWKEVIYNTKKFITIAPFVAEIILLRPKPNNSAELLHTLYHLLASWPVSPVL